MRRFLTLFIMLIFSGVLAFAQTRTISGTVRDVSGNPAGFVSVTETGTTNAVNTDANGNFSIKVKQSAATLVVTGVGYDKQEVNATGNNVAINLVRNTQELTTVVVTALGQVRQAKELGYSTAKIKAPELTQGKVVNLQNGLTGKVSGLNIQTVNNGVFADTRITLRGIRSLTGNNQPMLILDGVPIDLSYINTINPNDITDVTILKSSSSTAIYGPEGVNGAIVITTKRGSKNNPSVTLSHTIQLEKVTFMPQFQSKFGGGSSENPDYTGVYDSVENQGYGPLFDGSIKALGRVGPGGLQQYVSYIARPQEKKNFWSTGVTNQTDLSIAMGDFYLSFQNVDIEGVTPKDVNRRVSLHMSAVKEFSPKLKSSYSVQYTQNNYNVNDGAAFGNGRDYVPYWNVINTPMHIPITNYKNWQTDYFASPDGYFNDYYYNPYWTIDNFRRVGRRDNLLGNVEFNYKIAPSLNITYRLGGTYRNETYKQTQTAFTYSDYAKASGKSSAQSGDIPSAVNDVANYSSRLTSELFATYRKEFGKFKLDALLGQSFREIRSKDDKIVTAALGIPGIFNVGVRSVEAKPEEGTYKQRLQRFFGKVGLGFNNWAFLEFTGSNDIDSRLANPYNFDYDQISYFYPGASASVVLSEAIPAIKNGNLVSYLKFRGAISKTGNVPIGPYQLENTYSQTNGFPYGTTIGFSADNTLRQATYKPEFVNNKEVGVELGFLKNRINVEATAYEQKNTNQFITVAYSAATGYPNALLNAADFTNKGLEFDLRLTPLIRINKLSIDFKVNYTYQVSKVNRLLDGVDELGIGNGNFIVKGQAAYVFKLTDYQRDPQGRVIVDSITGYPSVDPVAKQFGQTLPKHILGFNLNVNFKGLSLSAVADHRGGNQIYSDIGSDMDFSGISIRSGQNNRQPFVFPNSVIEVRPDVFVPNTNIYTQSGGYNFWSQARNTEVQSNYISSGAFWKLREVALTYTFPSTMFGKKGLKGASVSFTGRNLLTWLPKTNEWTDPEFSTTTGNAQGFNDNTVAPPTRIFGANVTLQF